MIWQGEALGCEQKCELRAPVPMKYKNKAAVRLVLPEAFSADLEISLLCLCDFAVACKILLVAVNLLRVR